MYIAQGHRGTPMPLLGAGWPLQDPSPDTCSALCRGIQPLQHIPLCFVLLHCFHCSNTSQSSHCPLMLLILCSPMQKLATIIPVPGCSLINQMQFSAILLWIHRFDAILPRSLCSWDRAQSQAFIPASSPLSQLCPLGYFLPCSCRHSGPGLQPQ